MEILSLERILSSEPGPRDRETLKWNLAEFGSKVKHWVEIGPKERDCAEISTKHKELPEKGHTEVLSWDWSDWKRVDG